MTPTMDYVPLYQMESYGNHGFGLQILVAVHGKPLPDLMQDSIRNAAYTAATLVTEEMQAAVYVADPAVVERAKRDKESIISCFPDNIFVEEIPNEYSKGYYTRLSPWFIITTKIGRFKVGWRKSVIHLEWTDTLCKVDAEVLFLREMVTKQDRTIHAGNYGALERYVQTVMAAVKEEAA